MSTDALRRGVPGASTLTALRRRLAGSYDIDEWGLDPELVALVDPVVGLRWDLEVQGVEHIPVVGGAVLVANRRVGLSEPWVLARSVRRASGRFVRTVGIPDVAPVGPVLHRFGGVLDRTDEIAGLLRAGQLVGLSVSRGLWTRERSGRLDAHRLDAALATGAPVIPVALVGRELGRAWRVVIGEPIAPPVAGGPLAAAELAEEIASGVQHLLDEHLPSSRWPSIP